MYTPDITSWHHWSQIAYQGSEVQPWLVNCCRTRALLAPPRHFPGPCAASVCLEQPGLLLISSFTAVPPRSFPVHWPFPLTPAPPTWHLGLGTVWRTECFLDVFSWTFFLYCGSPYEVPVFSSLCAQSVSVSFILPWTNQVFLMLLQTRNSLKRVNTGLTFIRWPKNRLWMSDNVAV